MDAAYRQFLTRAAAGLAAAGARTLLTDDTRRFGAAPWTEDWDSLVLSDQPGAATLYAFGNGTRRSSTEVRARIDRLAAGVVSAGWLHPAGLRLVAVIVYPHGLDGVRPREITQLAPSTYFQGIRPATWVIDLPGERLYAAGLLKPEGRDILAEAARAAHTGIVLDPDGVQALEREHQERMSAFYQLMRGHQPVVTMALITINVILFLLLYAYGSPENESTLRDFGALSPRLVEQGQWWRMVTSMFLHASIPHILFNMTSLFAVGTLAERLYGSVKYLAIYLGSGLIGSLVSLGYSVSTGHIDVLGVGASGAIFGVAGALVTLRFQSSDVIPSRLRTRVSASIFPLVIISLVFSFVTPFVDNGAHVGGLLGGMALSFLFPVARQAPGAGESNVLQ
jgi:membrane associated rhomboid family serine protease